MTWGCTPTRRSSPPPDRARLSALTTAPIPVESRKLTSDMSTVTAPPGFAAIASASAVRAAPTVETSISPDNLTTVSITAQVLAARPGAQTYDAAMATTRKATTNWEGTLTEGSGRVTLDSSGLGTYDVTWPARAEEPGGKTSPEELIAAAHSSCYSMAFSNGLTKAGTPPERLDVRAEVTFQPGEGITGIHLVVRGSVPGLDAAGFAEAAEAAKVGCPVSKALAGTPITLDAALA